MDPRVVGHAMSPRGEEIRLGLREISLKACRGHGGGGCVSLGSEACVATVPLWEEQGNMKTSHKRGNDEAGEVPLLCLPERPPGERMVALLGPQSRRVNSPRPCPPNERTHAAGRAAPRPPRGPTHSLIYDRSVFPDKTDTVSADKC